MSHRPYSIGIPEQDPLITTDDHAVLQNVTANQHHAKSHTHDGSDGSGVVSYDSLTDQPTEVVEHSNISHVTIGFPEASAPGDGTQQGSSTSVARLDHQHSRENTIGAFGTRDHDLLTGLLDDDHTQYVLHTDVDDIPVDGVTDDPISSNWAFDHVAAADPHTGYRLESADHTHATSGLQAGTVAHSALTGLTAGDDHTQYRLESADHSHVSTGLQAGQLDHGLALTGLSDDDHTQYALESGSIGVFTTKDHDLLTGLTDDDHTNYALLAGRGTPQQFNFGTASGASTGYLSSTVHATKGKYFLNAAGTITIDELQTFFGINAVSPLVILHTVTSSGEGTPAMNIGGPLFQNNNEFFDSAVTILAARAGKSRFLFADADSQTAGSLNYSHSTNKFEFLSGTTTLLTIDSGGIISLPLTGQYIDLSAISAGNPNFKITATSDTPTVAFTGGGNAPTTAPAGYVEILVGATPYYMPFWA